MLVLRAPCSVLRAPCPVRCAPCSVLRAPCSVLRAPCSVLRAPCSVLSAAHSRTVVSEEWARQLAQSQGSGAEGRGSGRLQTAGEFPEGGPHAAAGGFRRSSGG